MPLTRWDRNDYCTSSLAMVPLLYRYVHGMCTDEVHDLDPQTYSLRIPLVVCKFHTISFSLRTNSLWKRLQRVSFPDHDNLTLFTSRIV